MKIVGILDYAKTLHVQLGSPLCSPHSNTSSLLTRYHSIGARTTPPLNELSNIFENRAQQE